jgi:hypothetical protein
MGLEAAERALQEELEGALERSQQVMDECKELREGVGELEAEVEAYK